MEKQTLYTAIPNMDAVLEDSRVQQDCAEIGRSSVTSAIRNVLEDIRNAIAAGTISDAVSFDEIVSQALTAARLANVPSLRRIINATGIIVHTNLGRSVLAQDAIDAVVEVASGYSSLEYDVAAGQRGSRHDHIEDLICEITGASAAIAVNNNASAVMMVLSAFAQGKEAIVSRGQLVEIGGSFRVPDIMEQSGVRLVEVGTTNKTHLSDYEKSLSSLTGMILKVHTSNYNVIGFTEQPTSAELSALGAKYGIPIIEDLGSGAFIDLRPFGLPYEPTVTESLRAGISLVTFSGDKLLGGPQAGIIAGSVEAIATLKMHPLARALRLDKMTLAALEATLRIYRDHDRALREIPTLRMLTMKLDESREMAQHLRDGLLTVCRTSDTVEVIEDIAYAGGGSMPMADIPSMVVKLKLSGYRANEIEEKLRANATPIIARIKDDAVLLDPRTFVTDDQQIVVDAISELTK